MRTDYTGSESSGELSLPGVKVLSFSVGTFAPRSEKSWYPFAQSCPYADMLIRLCHRLPDIVRDQEKWWPVTVSMHIASHVNRQYKLQLAYGRPNASMFISCQLCHFKNDVMTKLRHCWQNYTPNIVYLNPHHMCLISASSVTGDIDDFSNFSV